MRLTPGYLTAVATFYDMFDTDPVGEHQVYVCTNISCSLRGADAIYEEMVGAAGDDARFNVRSFECLGACDIAPMASVNGEYVGPLEAQDCQAIVDDVLAGRPPLEAKQLRRRSIARTHWAQHADRHDPSAGGRTASGPTASGNDVAGGKDM
jgi:hypothetical protein